MSQNKRQKQGAQPTPGTQEVPQQQTQVSPPTPEPIRYRCTGRRWQGFMIFMDGPKEAVADFQAFLLNYGVLFPSFDIEDPPEDLIACDRFYRRSVQLMLGCDESGAMPRPYNVAAFQAWLDKQYGIAPSAAECRLTVIPEGLGSVVGGSY